MRINQIKIRNNLKNFRFKQQIIKKFETKEYTESYFETKIDNFSSEDQNNFKLRYLYSNKFYVQGGPILLFIGDEIAIEKSWKSSSFITNELAKMLHATVIFAEHRFFGKSILDQSKSKFLTTEQVLEDLVNLIANYKFIHKVAFKSPVIVFGNSYGGMLAAWARMKYPHIFMGTVSNSAKLMNIGEKVNNGIFKKITDTFKKYDKECSNMIKQGFSTLHHYFETKNSQDLIEIDAIFKPCSPIKTVNDVKKIANIIESQIVAIGKYNYPYSANFEYELPKNPVFQSCSHLQSYYEQNKDFSLLIDSPFSFSLRKFSKMSESAKRKLNYLKIVSDIFMNEGKNGKCIKIDQKKTFNPVEYLKCSELIFPEDKNFGEMFYSNKFNKSEFINYCKKEFNIIPRFEFIREMYGGNTISDFKFYSNILFINGLKDPESSRYIKKSPNTKIQVMNLNTLPGMVFDSKIKGNIPELINARYAMKSLIEKWILESLN